MKKLFESLSGAERTRRLFSVLTTLDRETRVLIHNCNESANHIADIHSEAVESIELLRQMSWRHKTKALHEKEQVDQRTEKVYIGGLRR